MKLLSHLAGIALAVISTPAIAELRSFTYLLPAPISLPAFAPYHVAQLSGNYAEAGLDPQFHIANGGADVAIQVGAGNALIGHAAGDTPIIVRPNGLPVRAVALLGGRALTQIAIRRDVGRAEPSDLSGAKIGVMSFQDTSYYNLLAVLESSGVERSSVDLQALGPAGMVQLMISGDVEAISTVPEWSYAIEQAGVPLDVHMINEVFPSMTQAIVASENAIEAEPELLRAFIEATLQGYADVIADPGAAAKLVAGNVPAFAGKEDDLSEIMRLYGEMVYAVPDDGVLGRFDAERYEIVRDFYLEQNILTQGFPVEEYYTNRFVD